MLAQPSLYVDRDTRTRDVFFVFFDDPAATEIYTLSLHDALPIWWRRPSWRTRSPRSSPGPAGAPTPPRAPRSEEHTSELQSRQYLVCRLLLEKKKSNQRRQIIKTLSSAARLRNIQHCLHSALSRH